MSGDHSDDATADPDSGADDGVDDSPETVGTDPEVGDPSGDDSESDERRETPDDDERVSTHRELMAAAWTDLEARR